jgi:hypothetical protein
MRNFGSIKNAFNEILAESLSKKDSQKRELFKKYIKTIKESEILRTQFLVYNNIENMVESSELDARMYVKENVDLFKKFKGEDIYNENSKLISLSEEVAEKIKEDYDLKKMHVNLGYLIESTEHPISINGIHGAIKEVANYILTNKPKEVNEAVDTDIPPSMFASILIDKYNEKYADLEESDKDILKAVIGSTNTEKKEIYENTVRDCIKLIDQKLTEADLDTKDKLLRVKDKLLNDKQSVNEDEFISEIAKLASLKDTLIND